MDYNINNPFRAYVSLSDSIRKTIDEPEAERALAHFLRRANDSDTVFCDHTRHMSSV